MAKTTNTKPKQRDMRPLRKSKIVKTLQKTSRLNRGLTRTIVQGGIRKTSPIKKYEQMYYVPVSYFGLIELTKRENSWGNTIEYRGATTKDSPNGPIHCSVWMDIESKKYDVDDWDNSSFIRQQFKQNHPEYFEGLDEYSRLPAEYEEEYKEYKKMITDNMSDIRSVEVSGGFQFYIFRENGESETLAEEDSKGFFPSVEEFIQWVGDQSATTWGDAMVEYAEFNQVVEQYPDVIPLNLPGFDVNLNKSSTYVWRTDSKTTEDNIEFRTIVRIEGLTQERYNSDTPPVVWLANVINSIDDRNEHRYGDKWGYGNEPGNDTWYREFDLENETFEGIVANVTACVMETYQEFKSYVESERNYQTVPRGRGRKADVLNENEWVYYPTDAVDYDPNAPDYRQDYNMGPSNGKYWDATNHPYADVHEERYYGWGNDTIQLSAKKSKSSQPKSFNDMVKSIRTKNNQHKKRV